MCPSSRAADRSGTHAVELALWENRAGYRYSSRQRPMVSRRSGRGMGGGAQCGEWCMNGYVLSDRRQPGLSFKNRGDLQIVVEGDKRLFNQYGRHAGEPGKNIPP